MYIGHVFKATPNVEQGIECEYLKHRWARLMLAPALHLAPADSLHRHSDIHRAYCDERRIGSRYGHQHRSFKDQALVIAAQREFVWVQGGEDSSILAQGEERLRSIRWSQAANAAYVSLLSYDSARN